MAIGLLWCFRAARLPAAVFLGVQVQSVHKRGFDGSFQAGLTAEVGIAVGTVELVVNLLAVVLMAGSLWLYRRGA